MIRKYSYKSAKLTKLCYRKYYVRVDLYLPLSPLLPVLPITASGFFKVPLVMDKLVYSGFRLFPIRKAAPVLSKIILNLFYFFRIGSTINCTNIGRPFTGFAQFVPSICY